MPEGFLKKPALAGFFMRGISWKGIQTQQFPGVSNQIQRSIRPLFDITYALTQFTEQPFALDFLVTSVLDSPQCSTGQ
jgi:hypothetical protein